MQLVDNQLHAILQFQLLGDHFDLRLELLVLLHKLSKLLLAFLVSKQGRWLNFALNDRYSILRLLLVCLQEHLFELDFKGLDDALPLDCVVLYE